MFNRDIITLQFSCKEDFKLKEEACVFDLKVNTLYHIDNENIH